MIFHTNKVPKRLLVVKNFNTSLDKKLLKLLVICLFALSGPPSFLGIELTVAIAILVGVIAFIIIIVIIVVIVCCVCCLRSRRRKKKEREDELALKKMVGYREQ